MEGSIRATSTARFEELERSPSPAPSNSSSIYVDCDEESELPISSAAKDAKRESPATASNRTAAAIDAPFEVEFFVISSSKATTAITQDTKQESVSRSIIAPSTPPTLRNFSSQKFLDQLVRSPSSSSDRSNFSNSTLVDEDPESPITQRGSSPSREPVHQSELSKAQPAKPTSKKLPCLQCQLSNLICSFSIPPSYRRIHFQPSSKLCCTRCARNGESLCILQVAVHKEAADRGRIQTWGRKLGEVECEYNFFAEGVECDVASGKAVEMLEARRMMTKFALPTWSVARKNLKPVFGSWPKVKEEVEEEV